VAWEKVWPSGAAGAEAGCHRIVTEEAVYISLPDCPADGLGLIFLINEISCLFDSSLEQCCKAMLH